jgi:hypothetical protein
METMERNGNDGAKGKNLFWGIAIFQGSLKRVQTNVVGVVANDAGGAAKRFNVNNRG